MPIYEYQCDLCDHRFEKIQKFSDEPLKDCPECSKPSLMKLVSASSFRLKGGGWYETDFKTGAKKNGVADSSSVSSTDSDSKSDKNTKDKKSVKSSSKEGSNKNSTSADKKAIKSK